MTKISSRVPGFLRSAIFICLAADVSQSAQAASVTLSPGDNIQAAVKAAPAGTTFLLKSGVYRMQVVLPKAGDTFIGQGSVDFNGSEELSFLHDPAGSGLYVSTAVASTAFHGSCQSLHPLCGYSQDLFIDGQLQNLVSTPAGLKSGSWYFDRGHNKVYLPVNPAGHVVELGMESYAFYGSASNVHISNLTVEKYATPAQWGAVGGTTGQSGGLGSGWVVNTVETRWNHGGGIVLGDNSQILNSYVHNNGQIGIKFDFCTNCKAIKNEISWNNYAGFATNWEAGGSKFWSTTNLLVQQNYVHDNVGQGLWTDTNNVGTTYESNVVVNNTEVGILHEVSYSAVLHSNTVKGNQAGSSNWVGNGQIVILSSSNVEIKGNIIEVPASSGDGIVIVNQTRGTGTLGPWIASNNYVHNNTVTYLGAAGQSGMTDMNGKTSSLGNRFDYDRYIVAGGGTAHWNWFGHKDWKDFLALGREPHGVCCN